MTRGTTKGNRSRDDRFRLRPGAPKNRHQRFVSRVLTEVSRAGSRTLGVVKRPTGFGRGYVAARFGSRQRAMTARRVSVKVRLVNLRLAGSRSTLTHLRYIEREGVAPKGEPGRAYDAAVNEADVEAFETRGRGDRHQFRLIVSPEDAAQLEDLRAYMRQLMNRVEVDLGTRLDWLAVDHWDTDNPHTHVVLRGKDGAGKDLVIAGEYIAHGLRGRASEIATAWLGPRSELEIRQSLTREIEQERWTSLDRALQRQVQSDSIDLNRLFASSQQSQTRLLLLGRLRALQRMKLAEERAPGQWILRPIWERTLRSMGERGDIVRTMQRALGETPRELVIVDPSHQVRPIAGRVVAKGVADEHRDRTYLALDGTDGRAYFVPLTSKAGLNAPPLGAVIEVHTATGVREIDKSIAAMAQDGVYRTSKHLAVLAANPRWGHAPADLLQLHVRRLEALRRAGIVERLENGVWRVPSDLPSHGARYDLGRRGRLVVEVGSRLPLEQQVRAIGATWLDGQVIQGSSAVGDSGFGAEVRAALRQRVDFLVRQGLATRHEGRVLLSRNLLAILRRREIAQTGKAIASETGLAFRETNDGQRVSGIYRRNVEMASGRFAMLVDGQSFSLVPWRPVIARCLGRSIAATVRGSSASWELGWQRGLQIF